MTAKDRKLYKQIVDTLKGNDNYQPTDDHLILDLVDWLSIQEFKKKELKSDPGGYNIINNLSACSNQIQALMKLLSLTPQSRLRGKKEKVKTEFSLADFMAN